MGVLILPKREVRQSHIGNIDGIDPFWESLGISCAYVLSADKWKIDQVTQKELASAAGTGPTFPSGWLRNSSATAGNGALLPHNLATPIAQPVSFAWGQQRVLGSTLGAPWSLMNSLASYTGWWGSNTGPNFAQAVSGSISVNMAFAASITDYNSVVAVSKAANNVFTRCSTGFYAEDTVNTSPNGYVTATDIALGWFRANTNIQNATNYEYSHFIVFQSALPKEVAHDLATNPWQVFRSKPKKTYFFFADAPPPDSANAKAIYYWGMPF